MGNNRFKIGEKELDLAVEGWSLYYNSDHENIDKVLERLRIKNISVGNLEQHIEYSAAYEPNGNVIPEMVGIYLRGDGIVPDIPQEVQSEIKKFQAIKKKDQKAFLLDVYHQIKGDKVGEYHTRFQKKENNLAITLNYFADKLKGRYGNYMKMYIERHFN